MLKHRKSKITILKKRVSTETTLYDFIETISPLILVTEFGEVGLIKFLKKCEYYVSYDLWTVFY